MSANIEELRREKERLEKERAEIERQLAKAEAKEKAEAALKALESLKEYTRRIDALKHERQQVLENMRELAPRLGDYSYAAEDFRSSIPAARASMRQPELFDKLLAELEQAEIHIEPRVPRFRLFKQLYAIGTLQASSRRMVIGVTAPVLDPELLGAIEALDQRFPGLARITWASQASSRRLKPGLEPRRSDGDFAESLQFAANDTGTLDSILPLALVALNQSASWLEAGGFDEPERWFEPIEETPKEETPEGETSAPSEASSKS